MPADCLQMTERHAFRPARLIAEPSSAPQVETLIATAAGKGHADKAHTADAKSRWLLRAALVIPVAQQHQRHRVWNFIIIIIILSVFRKAVAESNANHTNRSCLGSSVTGARVPAGGCRVNVIIHISRCNDGWAWSCSRNMRRTVYRNRRACNQADSQHTPAGHEHTGREASAAVIGHANAGNVGRRYTPLKEHVGNHGGHAHSALQQRSRRYTPQYEGRWWSRTHYSYSVITTEELEESTGLLYLEESRLPMQVVSIVKIDSAGVVASLRQEVARAWWN